MLPKLLHHFQTALQRHTMEIKPLTKNSIGSTFLPQSRMEIENKLKIFIFTLLCGASKGFMKLFSVSSHFLNPLSANPQNGQP